MVSCSNYKPPKTYELEKTQIYDQSYNAIWSKIIRWFPEHNTPIKTIDKESGLISSEYNIYEETYEEFADCGTKGSGQITKEFTANFNIMVEKINGSKTKVTINCFFETTLEQIVYGHFVNTVKCNSKGKLEREIFDYIKQ